MLLQTLVSKENRITTVLTSLYYLLGCSWHWTDTEEEENASKYLRPSPEHRRLRKRCKVHNSPLLLLLLDLSARVFWGGTQACAKRTVKRPRRSKKTEILFSQMVGRLVQKMLRLKDLLVIIAAVAADGRTHLGTVCAVTKCFLSVFFAFNSQNRRA